jgi:hypothetical protein
MNLAEAEMPEFCERTLEAALTTENLFAVTWWCSHDVTRDLGDYKDLEYSLGLLDIHNQVKPLGRRFAEVVAEARRAGGRHAGGRAGTPARSVAVVVDVDADDLPLSRAALGPGGAVFERWHALRADGVAVAVVTSATAADPAALEARGIRELVRVDVGAR